MIVYSPMGSGLLAGRMSPERVERLPDDDWRKRDPRFRDPANYAVAERVAAVAERHGVAPGAVAVAWTLRNPAVDGAIVGFRRPDQVDPILPGAELDLTDEDVAELQAARSGRRAPARARRRRRAPAARARR